MKFNFVIVVLLFNFKTFSQSKSFLNLDKVLAQLNLKIENCYYEFIIETKIPYDTTKSILVIPEINENSEDYKIFNSHIVLIDNRSGVIKSKYTELNAWESGAQMLTAISIDFAPYILNKKTRAFGICTSYRGSSSIFGHSSRDISLFVQKDTTLVKILNNYEIYSYNGEQDFECKGFHEECIKTLIVSNKKSNNFNDILIKNKQKTVRQILNNDECTTIDSVITKKEILRFSSRQQYE